MASPSALDRAESRLLQPIYNALDTRNVAAALRASTQILPRLRSPKVKQTATAIKAHLLVLSKKRDEAGALVDELLQSPVDSEEALGYLRVTLMALDRSRETAKLYQDAFDRDPHNGSIGLQLCMAYVRTQNWAAVQLTAFRLHALLRDDPRPHSWAVFALLAQALAAGEPFQARLHLSLARNLLKAPVARNVGSPSHVWLNVRVLLAAAATAAAGDDADTQAEVLREAWTFLQSAEVQRIAGGNLEVDLVRWDVVRALGETDVAVWRAEWATLRARITGTDGVPAEDNYQLYLHLISLTVLLRETDGSLRDQAKELFVGLTERAGGKERGPRLALLQLETELASEQNASIAPLIDYFGRFGSKPCCFEDLRPFLPTVESEAQSLKEHLKSALEPDATSLDDVRVQVNALKILQHLAAADEAASIMERCKKLYAHGLPFGKDLNKDELQPVDDLVIIAVNNLVREWSTSADVSSLLQAVILLEHAQKASTMNHYFRLLLVRIYRLLGAPELAKRRYQALKVDHVQHDTLSHFIASRASTFAVGDGMLSEPTSLLALTGRGTAWFKQTIAADVEQLVLAVANEVYPQVADIGSYFQQLAASLQRQVLQLEYTKQALLPVGGALDAGTVRATAASLAGLPKAPLTDNRDFKLVPSYQPRGERELEELLEAGPRVDATWVERTRAAYVQVFLQAQALRGGAILPPPSTSVAPSDASSTTPDEEAFFSFLAALLSWSHAAATAPPKTQPPTDALRAFFAGQADRLALAVQDDKGQPWLVLHHAAVALDGFVLLILIAKALPASRTRTILDQASAALKALAAKLKQHAEKAGSAKTLKGVRASLPSLASAGVLDPTVAETVADVGSSRREALASLGKTLLDVVGAAVVAEAKA